MSFFYVLLVIFCALIAVYYYLTWPYNYWKKQGLKSAESAVPGFGNILSMLCFRENLNMICKRLYKCSDSSMFGMFLLRTPVLLVRDPELIHTIIVKKFSNFCNNVTHLDEHRDWFLSKNPFFAVDDTWRESRRRLLSGMSLKKLKIMFETMRRVSANFDEYLDRLGRAEVELRDLCFRFTGEIVCSAGFGIEHEESFVEIAEKLFEPNWTNGIRQTLNFFVRGLAKTFHVSFAPNEVQEYFADLAKNVSKSRRKEKGKLHEDFLHMAMDEAIDVDESFVLSILSSFFVDAFETVASIASFALFRLSQHTEVQEKLRKEIRDTLDRHEGYVSYDALKEMAYLEQVIKESMRLNPILEVFAKVCNEKTTLIGADGLKCTLRPGNLVIIPTQSLHTDEKYWDNPFMFNPERFNHDTRTEITQFTYLPFGRGPRMCPGLRLGYIEVKILMVTILRKCRVMLSPKTTIPLVMDPRSFLPVVQGGLWARLEPI
ncbi:cytochrome P450 6j1-like [Phymastichus coffea]|uniref:cytochrome P450 6j1-like n=1 Tax=Phymastichus coffea TaxID=108790 RepID=UPI00273A8018|nr:cytochrome P450 6j1-like [Phymastichus coffea]